MSCTLVTCIIALTKYLTTVTKGKQCSFCVPAQVTILHHVREGTAAGTSRQMSRRFCCQETDRDAAGQSSLLLVQSGSKQMVLPKLGVSPTSVNPV